MKMRMKEDSVEEMRKYLEIIITAREEASRPPSSKDPGEKGAYTVGTLHMAEKEVKSNPKKTSSDKSTNFQKNHIRNQDRRNMRDQEPSTSSTGRGHNENRKRKPDPNWKRNNSRSESNDTSKRRKLSCIFCQGDHFHDQCNKYKTVPQRRRQLKNRCYSCLSTGHGRRFCKNKVKCAHCQRNDHHRSLCYSKFGVKTETGTMTALDDGITLLQTAIVSVKHGTVKNRNIDCRLLLDSGSQRSYICKDISRQLCLPVLEENKLAVFGFASEDPQEYDSSRVNIDIRTKTNKTISLQVNEVPVISKGVAAPRVTSDKWEGKTLADDGSLRERIDILVGNDYYFNLLSTEKIHVKDNLFLINPDFGWILSGKAQQDDSENVLSVTTYCQNQDPKGIYFTEPDLPFKNMDLTVMWALESIGITDDPKTTREEEAVNHLNETILFKDGRYVVKWPWIQYPPDIPTNFGLAYGRLKGLLHRLDSTSINEYQAVLNEQLENGIIEIINAPEEDVCAQKVPPIHYMPHHMIKQEGRKGRIVYDASGKLKDHKSLNDCMYRGPSMLNDLVALLLQFRTHKVAIMADIEKAFLQIALQNEDRDVTRFLWIKDVKKPLSMDNIIHMRFCRVPFGIIASPFILTAVIKYHMTQKSPELLSKVIDKCYVDNFVSGAESTEEAVQLYSTTRRVFNEISMNMRDWTSNDKIFLKSIPQRHRAKKATETKVLGLKWNVEKDTLKLNIKPDLFKEENVTGPQSKRKILSTIASIYDPYGFSSTLISPAKLLLQDLWELKIKWDTTLPDELQRKWEEIIERVEAVKDIEIPRFIGTFRKLEKSRYELHVFSDASKHAYAAVAYLVSEHENTSIFFVMSKIKVTPKEEKENLRMPRLELLGCYLGSKLIAYINNVISITVTGEYLWTDSQIVLSWIHSNKLLPPFVARRVNSIRENKKLQTRYINTELNPADLGTRPETWEKKKTLWFNGPEFLKQDRDMWPTHDVSQFLMGQGPSDSVTTLMDIDCTKPNVIETTDKDTERSLTQVIQKLQLEYFPLETEGVKTSISTNLDLFKDVDGILRCNGRMKNANWSFDKRHPILIPRDCEFTNNLVIRTHRENYHMGANQTLCKIRDLYWIPRGKAYIQRLLRKCPECVKHSGGPFKLPSAPALPEERVNYTAPFTHVGVDYMGPLLINNGSGNRKRWICLYTCLVVRAVFLDVVDDLTASEGLLALRRMISTRGIPVMITSDNAQHFKLIAEIISSPYCIEKAIKWRFITPLSPWAGGFYERLIGIVKNCLKKTLEKHMLSDTQLRTVIKEIEAVVNSRPLTTVDSEPDHILRPSDFLTVGRVISVEESDKFPNLLGASNTKTELVKGWRRALTILKEFKDMFSNRYLLSLRERYHHLPKEPRVTSKSVPSIGQIVQIKGDSKNRNDWKVGKISELVPSADGACRAAKVQVGNSEYTRAIAHLYPLEVEENEDLSTSSTTPVNSTEEMQSSEKSPIVIRDLGNENTTNDKPHISIENNGNCLPDANSSPLPSTLDLPLDSTFDLPLDSTSDLPLDSTSDLPLASTSGVPLASTSPSPSPSNSASPPASTTAPNEKRRAAIKALEKIKTWSKELSAFLLHSRFAPPGSVATSETIR